MSGKLIQNPTLSYERYKAYQRHLNELNSQDEVDIDTDDLYKALRPTYIPSSIAITEPHVKEWVTEEALTLVVNIVVRDLINRGSYTPPLNVVLNQIKFDSPNNNWTLRTSGDINLTISSSDLNRICVDTEIIPKALLLFNDLTAVTLRDILNDVDLVLKELMTIYKPVTPKQAVLAVLEKLTQGVRDSTEPQELHGIICLGEGKINAILKRISEDAE